MLHDTIFIPTARTQLVIPDARIPNTIGNLSLTISVATYEMAPISSWTIPLANVLKFRNADFIALVSAADSINIQTSVNPICWPIIACTTMSENCHCRNMPKKLAESILITGLFPQ